jgi:uncharacterized membrane protein YccC
MAIFTTLSKRGFLIGTAILFSFLFLLNYHLYVMPDALSVTVGGLLGAFIFAWVALRVTKFIMKDRAPESRSFILIIASMTVVTQSYPALLKLFS